MRTKETEEIAKEIFGDEKSYRSTSVLKKSIWVRRSTATVTRRYQKIFPTDESRFERSPEGGESLRDVRRRGWEILEDREKKYEGKNILVVSHEYPGWMLSQAA